MKKLFLILFCVICYFVSNAQPLLPVATIPNPNAKTGFANYGWLKVDSGMVNVGRDTNFTPRYLYTTIIWPNAGIDTSAWVYVSTVQQRWRKIVTLSQGIGGGVVVAISGNSPVLISGTSTNPIISVDTTITLATKAYVQNQLGGIYIRVSDSATMLIPYLRKTDTLSMLLPYLRKTDTSVMLTPYLRKSDTSNMLANYVTTPGYGLTKTTHALTVDTSLIVPYTDTLKIDGVATKSFVRGSVTGSFVPYTGATGPVNLGNYDLTVYGFTFGRGHFPDATNLAIGGLALSSNLSGTANTAAGFFSQSFLTSGLNNSSFGANSLFAVTTGSYNTAVGTGSLFQVTTGNRNTGVGNSAGVAFSGSDNVFIGANSGSNSINTGNGSFNTYLGSASGYNTSFTNINNLTLLGYNTSTSIDGISNSTAIGSGAQVNTSNQIILGNPSVTSVATAASLSASGITLAPQQTVSYSAWKMVADAPNRTYTIYNDNANLSLQVGYESRINVFNLTGSAIPNGAVVFLNGSSGESPTIALAQSNNLSTTMPIAITTEAIANGFSGAVTVSGVVHGMSTVGFNTGQIVYVSSATPGTFTATPPSSPNYTTLVGVIGAVGALTGTLSVYPSTPLLGVGGYITAISPNGTNGLTVTGAYTSGVFSFTYNASVLTPVTLTVSGNTQVAGLTVTGGAKINTLSATGNAAVQTLSVVGNTTIGGTLISTGTITGTLATASQTNVTTLGTQTNLTVTGLVNGANGFSITGLGRVTNLSVLNNGTFGNMVTAVNYIATNTSGYGFASSVAGVNPNYGISISTPNGGYFASVEGTTANTVYPGSLANGTSFGTVNGTSVQLVQNNRARFAITSTGNLDGMTGTLTLGGQLLIGPSTSTPTANAYFRNYSSTNNYAQAIFNSPANYNAIGQDGSGNFLFGTATTNTTNTSFANVWLQLDNATGAATVANLIGTVTRTVLVSAAGLLSAPISDSTVKQKIKPLGDMLSKVMLMNPVEYEFKDAWAKQYGVGVHMGQLAQEIKSILPDIVFYDPKTGKYGINYGQGDLEAVMIKAIQQLKKEKDIEVATLSNKIDDLTNRLNELEKILNVK